MIRFLHTSDWQLGMTRHFLSEGAQERYNQARFDAIREMGRLAREEQVQFLVVCGDVFESNQVDRKTVARALDALKEVPVPVFILPGNHDPLNPASVYRSSIFTERRPPQVQVLENPLPLRIADGVELVGGPWLSKRPVVNPILGALEALEPAGGLVRICLAHGAVDLLAPEQEAGAILPIAALERAIAEEKIHFVALGDRHSLTQVGGSRRIWYSGTPEVTDFRETHAGQVLLVELEEGRVSSQAVPIGQWRFIERERVDLYGGEDLEGLRRWLEEAAGKERTVLRLNLVGSLSLSLRNALEDLLLGAEDVFAACEVREEGLLVLPEETDFANLGFSGFADGTVRRLRRTMAEGGEAGGVAREALLLLLRLAKGAA